MLRRVLKKSRAHILFVFIAFTLMVAIGSLFVSITLQKSSLATITVALEETEKTIRAYLREPMVLFNNVYISIQDMLDRGESQGSIEDYMRRTTASLSLQESDIMGFVDVYGYIRDELLTGMEWGDVGDDYIPQQRPWYQTAIRSDGVEYTAPYIDAQTNLAVMSLVQMLNGNNGENYGVLAMDIDISWLMEYAEALQFVEGGYGMIVTQYLYVVAHPNEHFMNLRLQDLGESYADIANMLRRNQDVSYVRIRDFDGSEAIVFFKELYNGWYVGVIVPTKAYYADLRLNIVVLVALGLVLAGALSYILLRLTADKNRSEEESKSKSSFLAMMSHEIRTPMNAILGITDILRQNESLNNEVEEGLVKINNSCELLLGIINDILDISKIESSKMDITPSPYQVASLINDSAQLNMMRIGSKRIEFEMEIDENTPARLVGDELRIKQVLNNILSNAFKYTEGGSVILSVASEPKPGKNEVTLLLTVRDTGCGMTAEQLGEMFSEYSRFSQEANSNIEGTGLGMAITKNLISLMGGEILVESEPGKGSMFSVRLPQATVDNDVLGSELAENLKNFRLNYLTQMNKGKIMRDPMPYGSVLIVDDVETNLYVASGLMKLYKLKVDTAASGIEAISKVESGKTFDIIFMDHMMPEMDGVVATHKLRGLGYSGTIIALTANAVAGQKEMFLQNGFDDFISKPIDVRMLNSALNKYVRDKHSEEDIEAALMPAPQDETSEGADQGDDVYDKMLESIGTIAEINTELGLQYLSGEKHMYCETLQLFHKKLASERSSISTSLAAGYISGFTISVHTLKSMLATIGAKKLSDMAADLERASKENEFDFCVEQYPELDEKLNNLYEQLSGILTPGKEELTEQKQGDTELLLDGIKKVIAANEAFDNDTGIETIEELLKFDFGSRINDLLIKTQISLEEYDFDNATDALNDITDCFNQSN